MTNERALVSRNKREGKYIPGWCYNPNYKPGTLIPKKRAGGNYALAAARGFNDHGYIIPGVTYVRYLREGAFQ